MKPAQPAKPEGAYHFRSNIVRDFDRKFIDVLTEMVNGGIAYWATDTSETPHEYPLLFVIEECETLQGQQKPNIHQITVQTLMVGIDRILTGTCPINSRSLGNIACAVVYRNTDYLDENDVDLICQAGLYNEIMWG